ncbi:uncharacterized protein LOC118491490 [Helianthus annuus]|uniref:uncharacterized protein LOC118491490 n=1 Tax=Helianthus annuus TaxID=4232 RepID=UPI001653297C|nr:uncharacterized protein LOC118491490 [Helianthus annuus]
MSVEELQQFEDCCAVIDQAITTEDTDGWRWLGIKDEEFSVAAVKQLMMQDDLVLNEDEFVWCKWIPIKCNIFMWRAERDRLPTKVAIRKRNIALESAECSLCGDQEETAEHLFTGCSITTGVWQAISAWCQIPQIFAFSIRDLLDIHKFVGGSKIKPKVIRGVVIVTCWKIWKTRNDRVFSQRDSNVANIVADVKSISFLWFKHRFKKKSVDWNSSCTLNLM